MIDLVRCSRCREEKESLEFNKDKSHTNGLKSECRDCTKGMYKRWYRSEDGLQYKKNYDRNVDKDYTRKKNAKWRDANSERHHQNVKEWRKINPDKVKEYEHNRPSRAEWYRKKRREDLNYRLAGSLRSRLRAATRAQLAGGSPKKGSAIENLGCSMDEFILHLEGLFQEGMSWNNYGDWHIDHVLPLSGFDLSDSEQVKKACHFTNLQPLWAGENLSKGARVEAR